MTSGAGSRAAGLHGGERVSEANSIPEPPSAGAPVREVTTPGKRLARRLDERTAIPVAVVLACLFGVVDVLTGADVTVNFLYQIPIFIGAWHRGWKGAVVAIAVAMTGRVLTLSHFETPTLGPLNIVWNIFAETVAFVGFAIFVLALRSRAQTAKNRLLATTEQLRHADRLTTLGKLAAGVAHELGTPLHVVMLRAEMIARSNNDQTQAVSNARSILKQGDRMAAILRQLLEFGRRAAGTRARADLRAIAKEAAELVSPAANKQRVGLQVLPVESPVWADVNPAEMEQVVSNLLLNAVQASPPGAVVTVEVGRRETAGSGGAQTVGYLAVKDAGGGIRPEHLPHVFDPFFTTKDVGEGTGLGLSVSFGIVSDHGGRIDVESQLGAGTTFTVLLPE